MYAKVLAIGEFRGLWLGGLFAMTFVPALVGGPALGWLADRYPRREVTIACDVARTVLIGLVALPGLPLPALCALIFASSGMVAAQGLGILLGGLLVEAAGPEHGLAIAGAAGLVAGVPVLLAWNRAT
ncbi:hypothetical protein ACTWPV_49720, partial [Nonomuraea sp. KM88]